MTRILAMLAASALPIGSSTTAAGSPFGYDPHNIVSKNCDAARSVGQNSTIDKFSSTCSGRHHSHLLHVVVGETNLEVLTHAPRPVRQSVLSANQPAQRR
jgi:hypothetical protein